MECSPKHKLLLENDILREDFLWCGRVKGVRTGRPWKTFWKEMQLGAQQDVIEWYHILDSMARFECRVEVKAKPNANYEEFLPEAEHQNNGRAQAGTSMDVSRKTQGNMRTNDQLSTPFSSVNFSNNRGLFDTSGHGPDMSSSAMNKPSTLREALMVE